MSKSDLPFHSRTGTHRSDARSPKAWLHAAVATITISFVLSVFPHLYNMWEHNWHGYDYWFEYYSVKPVKNSFNVGEPIVFRSEAVFYRESPILWNDVINCNYFDDEIGMHRVTSTETSNPVKKKRQRSNADWTYEGVLPTRPGECIGIHTITVANKWAKKSQVVAGPVFYITETTQ